MTEDKRQELFQDAQPAEGGGMLRLVTGLMGAGVLFATVWIGLSLRELRSEVRSIEEAESEIRALRAELAAFKSDSETEFDNVKETLSGVWHLHKPAELEFMGFFASRTDDERQTLLAALEELDGNSQTNQDDLPGTTPSPKSRSINSGGTAEESPEESSLDSPEQSAGNATEGSAAACPEDSAAEGPEDSAAEGPEDSAGNSSADSAVGGVEESPAAASEQSAALGPAESSATSAGSEDGGESEKIDPQEDIRQATKYTVQRGDSLSRIAQKHDVSAEAIALANGISNPDRIRVGQTLKIPGK